MKTGVLFVCGLQLVLLLIICLPPSLIFIHDSYLFWWMCILYYYYYYFIIWPTPHYAWLLMTKFLIPEFHMLINKIFNNVISRKGCNIWVINDLINCGSTNDFVVFRNEENIHWSWIIFMTATLTASQNNDFNFAPILGINMTKKLSKVTHLYEGLLLGWEQCKNIKLIKIN